MRYGYGRFWGSVGMGILRPVGMAWNPIPTATLAMVIVFDSRRKWRCNLGQSTRDVTKAIVTQNVHKWCCCGRVTTTYCYRHRNYCHKNCWHHQVMSVHWRRQGGAAGGPRPFQRPGKIFFAKIEGLSSFTWSGFQHVYLYSLFNWNSKVLLKKPGS